MNAVGNTGDLALVLGRVRRRQRLTAFAAGKKILHRAADFAAALDGEIGPGQPGIVAQYDRGGLR